jgi:hypothetical protein
LVAFEGFFSHILNCQVQQFLLKELTHVLHVIRHFAVPAENLCNPIEKHPLLGKDDVVLVEFIPKLLKNRKRKLLRQGYCLIEKGNEFESFL